MRIGVDFYSKFETVKMASGDDFNPPADLLDKRAQTKYRIEREMRILGKTMNQRMLNNAAREASEKEREKRRSENLRTPWADEMREIRALEAGERERARLIAEERNRLKDRGELNISSREKFNVGLEEKNKTIQYNKSNKQQQKRMLAMDHEAAGEMEKELGPAYRLSPKVLTMNLNPPRKLPDNWRTGQSQSSENSQNARSQPSENWRKNRSQSPENWRKK